MNDNKLEVLVSTMNRSSWDDLPIGIKSLSGIDCQATVVNQTSSKVLDSANPANVNFISKVQKGLSKSRNLAIENAIEEICIVADDDVAYVEGFQETILNAYRNEPNADIIVFQVETPEGDLFKNYPTEPKELKLMDLMKVSSIEITFNREQVVNREVRFDERFGLGTNLPSGEEALFLVDAIRKGLRIFYVPERIVIHPKESSGHNFRNNDPLIESKGALIARVFKNGKWPIVIGFALKKYRKSGLSFLNFVSIMKAGERRLNGKY